MSPSFSDLIRKARARLGYDLAATARRAGCSESYISLIETEKRLPSEELAVRLARTLELDPTEALLALVRSRLPAAMRGALDPAALVRDPRLQLDVLRDFLARHFEARIERIESRLVLDWNGGARLTLGFHGFSPLPDRPPVKELVLRERLGDLLASGEVLELSKPVIHDSPRGLHYEQSTRLDGRDAVLTLTFPEGWSHGGGKLSFETRLAMRKAFPMDLQSTLAARGPARNHLLSWALPRFVNALVETVRIEVELPEGYEPAQTAAWAWLGDRSFEDVTDNLIERGVCRGHEVTFSGPRLGLTVDGPLPFYTFAVAWQPLEHAAYLDARRSHEG